MDRVETGGAGKLESKNVADAKAAFRELESTLDELGNASAADLRVYGVMEGDIAPAAERIFQIRKIAATNKALVEKEHPLHSEEQDLIEQSSIFSNSASYIRYILGKKGDAERVRGEDMTRYRTSESAKSGSIIRLRNDIEILLGTLSEGNPSDFPDEKVDKLRKAADILVKESGQDSERNDATLLGLNEMLATLRKDALALMYDREHMAEKFPQM